MRTCVGWARGIGAQHVIGLALLVAALFTAQASTLAQETDWSGLIEQAKPAVVWIVVETSEGTSAGSGALISPNGYILTAGHVVSGASKITVVVDDSREYRATVTEADYDMDVALLKIPASGLTWLALGDSDDVGYDEEIRVLGYPLPGHAGVGFAAVAGKIQGFRANDGVRLLQHDAPTEGGHSGGAVINSQGEIVAVHTSWIGGEHSQYTIGVAINSAKKIIPSWLLPSGPSPVQPIEAVAPTMIIRVPQDFADLASAVRAAADGSEIQVARGTYHGDVSITKSLIITGEDGAVIRGSVRILSANSVYLRDLAIVGGVEVRNSNGVTLESLVLQDSQGDGVFVAEASVSVRDCTIVSHQGDGVAATFESRLMISDCQINENMGTGINVALGSQASINENTVTANGGDGIAVFGATADLRNNVLRQNAGYGLNADASATLFGTGNQAGGDVPEEFATITAAVSALNKQGGKSSAVPAGIISSAITIGSGIYEESIDIAYSVDLIGAGPTLTILREIRISGTAQVMIQDLAVMENSSSGILVEDSAHATVGNCTISENYQSILVMDSAHATIENCTITENRANGICIADSAQVELNENVILWNRGYGISAAEGTVLTGENNVIPGGAVPGEYTTMQDAVDGGNQRGAISVHVPAEILKRGTIKVAPGTYEEDINIACSVDLIGDGLTRTFVRTIEISGTAFVLLQDLTAIQGSGNNGVIALYDTAQATIESCAVKGGWMGISIHGSARATIENCTISENNYGIWVGYSAQATIENCTISENEIGIDLDKAAQATIVGNVIRNNAGSGIFSSSSGEVAGHDNRMSNNGVDLEGDMPGALRVSLEPATQREIHYPDPSYGSLQSAVDALIAGGRLVLQAGVYEAGVTIAKQIEISAMEGALVTLQGRGDDAPVLSLVRRADLTLIGVVVTEGSIGLRLGGDAKATIEDCAISENRSGVYLRDAAQATIENCTVSGSISVGGSAEATIENCTVSGSISVGGSAEAAIENCTVSGSRGDGISLHNTAKATIDNCSISGNGSFGVFLGEAAEATIVNNDINNNVRAGISTYYAYYPLGFDLFVGEVSGHGNVMQHNGVDLIGNVPGTLRAPLEPATQQAICYPDPRYSSLQSAVDALLTGGQLILQAGVYEAGITIAKQIEITAEEGAQVTLQGRSEDAPVLSLVPSADLALHGVMLESGRSGLILGGDAQAMIENCTISGSSEEGIVLGCTAQATIESCTISGSGKHGIMLGYTARATIVNCHISGNERIGITFRHAAQATIEDCTISENECGVYLTDAAQATVENCTISESRSNGIGLIHTAKATIESCTISGSRYDGIKLGQTAEVTIVNCSITNNASYGIRCSNFTGQVTGSDNIIPGLGEPDENADGALSPVYPGAPWPDGFLKE